jgi:YD repeat-containing protein
MSDSLVTNNAEDQQMMGQPQDLRHKYDVAKHAVADLATEASQAAKDRLTDITGHASEWMRDKSGQLKEKTDLARSATMTYVRRNPYKSMALAAGAGLLIGFMLHRRRD